MGNKILYGELPSDRRNELYNILHNENLFLRDRKFRRWFYLTSTVNNDEKIFLSLEGEEILSGPFAVLRWALTSKKIHLDYDLKDMSIYLSKIEVMDILSKNPDALLNYIDVMPLLFGD